MRTKLGTGALVSPRLLLWGGVLLAAATALPARSATGAELASGGSQAHGSARELHTDALRALPLAKLTPQGRNLATKILNETTIFRRLPQQVIECHPDLYLFMVEHPEMVVNMWEVMGITNVTIKKLGPTSYRIDDGQGTSGDIHFLYRSRTQHIVYCEGTYTGSMLPRPIKGRCILSLRSAHVRDADDRDYVQCRLDSFVQLDSFGVEVFAKTFQGMIGSIADHNFRETTGFVSSVSIAAESAPENLHRIASKCRRVAPEIKQEFTTISDRVYRNVMGAATTANTAPTDPADETATAGRAAATTPRR